MERLKPNAAPAPRPYIEEEHDSGLVADPVIEYMSIPELKVRIESVNSDMIAAARRTEFLEAARLRDELIALQSILESKEENLSKEVEAK